MKTDADVLFLYEREKDLDSDKMNLSYDIFKDGVHVFDNLKTGSITLRSTKSKKAITLSAPSYPYMGNRSPEKVELHLFVQNHGMVMQTMLILMEILKIKKA